MTAIGFAGVDCQAADREFASYKRVTADMPVKGAMSLYVGATLPPLGVCALASNTPMVGGLGDTVFFPDFELVRIRLRRNGRIYFDRPLQRTWHGNAVIPLGVPILEDVQLIGGKGPIHVGLADRVTIRNWEVSSYNEARAISVQSCKDVQIEGCKIDQVGGTGQPGTDYGIQIQRCAGADITNCRGVGNRHFVTLFGSVAASIRDCLSANSSGTAFDLHFSCEDCLFEDCDSGLSDFSVNNKWAWGCHGITIRRMRNAKMLWLHGDASVIVEDSKFLGPLGLMRNAYSGPQEAILRGSTSFGRYSQGSWLHMEGAGPFNTRIVMEGLNPQVGVA